MKENGTNANKAARWLHDPEMHAWRQARLHLPRIIYLDRITEYWRAFYRMLPAQARQLVWVMMLDAPDGEIAKVALQSRVSVNTVSSTFSRLVKLGVLVRKGRGHVGIARSEAEALDWTAMRGRRRFKLDDGESPAWNFYAETYESIECPFPWTDRTVMLGG